MLGSGMGSIFGRNLLNEVWGRHFSPSLVSTSNLPCWLVEEFVVAEECAPCSSFRAVSIRSLSVSVCRCIVLL